MNELIMPHNAGVKRVLESMREVLALYKNVKATIVLCLMVSDT